MVFDYYTVGLLTLAAGFLMAYGIGANDVANAMATSVGSKALKMRQALLIAAVFEFTGAFFAGSSVTSTIRKGIVPEAAFGSGDILILAMLAALLSAGLWLLVASWRGEVGLFPRPTASLARLSVLLSPLLEFLR